MIFVKERKSSFRTLLTSMTTAHLPGKGRSLGGDTKELLVGPDVEFPVTYLFLFMRFTKENCNLARAAMV